MSYRLAVPTTLSKAGTRIFAAPTPCDGGATPCDPVDTDYCSPYPIPCLLTATFGGTMSGAVTLTYDSGTGLWEAAVPFNAGCDEIILMEFGAAGPAGYSLSIEGAGFSGVTTGGIAPVSCPGLPPDTFVWESGDLTADGGGCAGTFTVTVTEGAVPEPPTDYHVAVSTGLTKDGVRIFAAVDCSQSGATQYRRVARDTGLTKNGKRIFVAEADPCCDGGITPTVLAPCCATPIPRTLYLTVTGSSTDEVTVALTWNGDTWFRPIDDTPDLMHCVTGGAYSFMFGCDVGQDDCVMEFFFSDGFDNYTTTLQAGWSADPVYYQFVTVGTGNSCCGGGACELTFTITSVAP